MQTTTISLLCILILTGCTSSKNPSIKYSCDIPYHLSEKSTHRSSINPNDDHQHHTYREYHQLGWYDMVEHYINTSNFRINEREWHVDSLEKHAYSIGSMEAQTMIKKLEISIGKQTTHKEITDYYKYKN